MFLTRLFYRCPCLLLLCTLGAGVTFAQPGPALASKDSTLFEQARAFENGEGVTRDTLMAAKLYCEAARNGDRDAQYNLGWMYANGRGVERNDGRAVFLFQAAAEQGIEVAQRLLARWSTVAPEMPDCMRPPAPAVLSGVATLGEFAPVDYALIAPRKIFNLVQKLAPQFKVEPQLALSIIAAESNFNHLALSDKNAQGLMQLIPQTSERFNVKNAFDPAQNIRGGLTYLRWLLAYFEGDVALVAAAYNAGEGTVDRYRGVPPYSETRNYVKRVLRSFGAPSHPFDIQITRPSAMMKK